MGAQHDRANASSQGVDPYSYGYWLPNGLQRTIMAYDCTPSCTRIKYFSNPNVTYVGIPTGISYDANPSQSADNARTLNNSRVTVANFRVTGPVGFNKTAPTNNATGVSTAPTLSWGVSSDASSYEYCVDTSHNASCDSINGWINIGAATSVNLLNLAGATAYSWQVRARNSNGTT
jgi:hypothetical protein